MRVRKLSGGQRRRLDLAVGLSGDPELLFLDEPTTGFDPTARRQAWDMVKRLTGSGRTVLLTTHFMDEAQLLADRLAVLVDGRIVAEGTPAEVVAGESAQTLIRVRVRRRCARHAGCPGLRSRRQQQRRRGRAAHRRADPNWCTTSRAGPSTPASCSTSCPSAARPWRMPTWTWSGATGTGTAPRGGRGPPADRGAGSTMTVARLIVRQVRYENTAFWRNPAAAFFTFVFPLIFMVLFNMILAVGVHRHGERGAASTPLPSSASRSSTPATRASR